MAFWSSATEPLRKNRWTVIFGDENGLSRFSYALKKVDKPSYKTLDITHKFGNYSFYYPGRVEWNTINMTFVSAVDAENSVDKNLLSILKGGGGAGATGIPDLEKSALRGISKKNIGEQIGTIEIFQLSSDGTSIIEKWKLINPFFTNIKFGELSYDSEEVVDVEVTVRYDTAEFSYGTSQEA